MINQKLYIEVLELFDLIKEEDIFIKYKQLEQLVLNDKEIRQLINEYNFINETIANVEYEPFIKEQELELIKIQDKLNSNQNYCLYLDAHFCCNKRLNEISELIFKDIVSIGGGCSCK